MNSPLSSENNPGHRPQDNIAALASCLTMLGAYGQTIARDGINGQTIAHDGIMRVDLERVAELIVEATDFLLAVSKNTLPQFRNVNNDDIFDHFAVTPVQDKLRAEDGANTGDKVG